MAKTCFLSTERGQQEGPAVNHLSDVFVFLFTTVVGLTVMGKIVS